jgi:D-sedoheptulose 7-phosphate isomerase
MLIMNHLQTIFSQSNDASSYAKEYLVYLSNLLANMDTKKIEEIVRLITQARQDNKTIYLIGNGGSAVCASHWCNDLTNGTKVKGKKTIKAISLTDNTASITALANDSGYENIFVLQLENLLNPGDVVIGISASGNSPNVVKAFEFANSAGATTVALIGFDGGAMKSISKVVLHIPTNKGEYGPVEDIQLVLDHLISSYIRFAIERE